MISHLFQEMASGSDGCRQALCKVIYRRFQLTWNVAVGQSHVHVAYTYMYMYDAIN
jgi:hypothetical protein